jgi:hypothetical protein
LQSSLASFFLCGKPFGRLRSFPVIRTCPPI